MLVITALTSKRGFPSTVYQRFAGSLAATGFSGDIVIMTTEEEINQGRLHSLERELDCLSFVPITIRGSNQNINCHRYAYFYDYLKSKRGQYEYVMLTDSRDVIFQRDISKFPFPEEAELYLAEEEKLIGDCKYNSKWVREVYGDHCLQQLRDKPVLCSGTTIGRPSSILSYMEAMINEVNRVEDDYLIKNNDLGGIDQGILNYLYYTKKLGNLRVSLMPNSKNMVYTLHHVANDSAERVLLDTQNRFINQNGELCYCIHQFDRLDTKIREQFNSSSPWSI